jgi:PIN domain nuclease of toxin-antitoxin system
VILLDTHTLVWLDEGNKRLGSHSLSMIDKALQSNELYISSISFREVAMLVKKGRLEMQISIELWRKNLLENGLQELSLTGDTAIHSALLDDFHGDPADRMIVATAIQATAKLCTADEKILAWKSKLLRFDARK